MMISEPPVTTENKDLAWSVLDKRHALWQLSFRAFFLAASLFSVIAIALWVASLSGQSLYGYSLASSSAENVPFLPSLIWHAHEMIFGFAATVAMVLF